jgi:hypothetical protein
LIAEKLEEKVNELDHVFDSATDAKLTVAAV